MRHIKYKKILYYILIIITFSVMINGCKIEFDKTAHDEENNGKIFDIDLSNKAGHYKDKDLDFNYDLKDSSIISCKNNKVKIKGAGVYENEKNIIISENGTYIFRGKFSDNQIMVDADKDDNVKIVLDNAELETKERSVIYIKNAKRTTITLAKDTENSLTDGEYYDKADNAPDAVIYSKDNLVINGEGALVIKANYKHGIKTEDNLSIISSRIEIISKSDGLRSKDSVSILSGDIKIDSQSDAIISNNKDDKDKGMIYIDGGTLNLTSQGIGIRAESGIIMTDGRLDITSIKDAVFCSGDIDIKDAELNINTKNDAIHADGSLTIDDGSINIIESYEGLEAASIDINGGTFRINSMDDGINAAGGNDDNNSKNDDGQFKDDAQNYIRITNGYVYIKPGGDGMDSNGNLYLLGGTIVIDGCDDKEEFAFDTNDANVIYEGDTLLATGKKEKLDIPTKADVPVIVIFFDQVHAGENIISISSYEGQEILTMIPDNDYESIILSCPEFVLGESYILSVGGEYNDGQTIDDTYYHDGIYSGGTELLTFKFEDNITIINHKD